MNRDTFFATAKKHSVEEQAKIIWELRQPAIQIDLTKVASDDEVPVGASKFGGLPDLPPGTDYPYHYEQALVFVCQLNCADLKRFDGINLLPETGLLSFFFNDYIYRDEGWYDTTNWRVWYFEDVVELQRLEVSPAIEVYDVARTSFEVKQTIPQLWSYIPDSLRPKMDRETEDMYLEFEYEILPDKNDHCMYGHPNEVQGGLFAETELFAQGGSYSLPQVMEQRLLDTWRLLLQVDSVYDLDMIWGDAGRLYYCIREDDLKARAFDRAVCTAQGS